MDGGRSSRRRSVVARKAQKLRGLVLVVHPFPVAVVTIASVAVIWVERGGDPGLGILARAAGVVLASQVLVGALNDLVDRHVDACTQAHKPIPSGLVSANAARVVVLASALVLVPLAATFGPLPFGLVIAGSSIGVAYDLWLKSTVLAALAYIAGFLTLFTWLCYVAGALNGTVLIVLPGATLTVVAGHLANSYPDLESDRAASHWTLAVALGPTWTFRLLLACYAALDAGGLALAARSQQELSIALLIGATLLGMAGYVMCRRGPTNRHSRRRLFYLMGLGFGCMAVGALLALRAGTI